MHFRARMPFLKKKFWFVLGLLCLALIGQNLMASSVTEDRPPIHVTHQFGVGLYRGAGLATGLQVGMDLNIGLPIYVGPDLSYTVYREGGLLLLMGGGSIEFKISSAAEDIRVGLGLASGVGVPRDIIGVPNTTWAVISEFFVRQQLDPLSSLRVQFRPGLVAGNMAFMVNLNLQFRFY